MKAQVIFLSLVLSAMLFSAPSFVHAPVLSPNSGQSTWTITFELSEASDVEVSIIRKVDSTVIRHLAAGVLGAKPPAPFTANSLSQSLTWDGKDDFGTAAPNPESLSVRVRAGMTPRLMALIGDDVYSFMGGGRSSPSLTLEPDGSVLILGKNKQNSYLRKYDAAGNYLKRSFLRPRTWPRTR